MHIDLEDLRFEGGGALLVKRGLHLAAVGEAVTVAGHQPDLAIHLRAWCRAQGHEFRSVEDSGTHARIIRGPAADQRWSAAERAGQADAQDSGAVLDRPSQRWGLAARGALVEAGSPEFAQAAAARDCADIGRGHDAVSVLVQEMHRGRKRRLLKLGFSDANAEEMSALHPRNFM